MNIKYCPIEGGNFGDTLNTMVWDRLFPDLTLHKEDMLVYGIGTLLDGRHDQSRKKIVLGSGIGEAHAAMPDPNWDFRWVRGPLSAQPAPSTTTPHTPQFPAHSRSSPRGGVGGG